MRNLLGAASILLLVGSAAAQTGVINSPSGSTYQNQQLTGTTGQSAPPAPLFNGGDPGAEDRVSGTPANATTMHLESAQLPAESPLTAANPPAADAAKIAQQAVFESATQSPAQTARTKH
jgi:hypothetical protein